MPSQNDMASVSTTVTEGTLQLVIQNFRHMTDTIRGPSKYIQNVPWRIMVMPRQHVVQKKGTQKCLGFFLQCCPDAYSDSWSCQASAELRLISQKAGVPNFTRKTSHAYTAKENDWGYSCFMTWSDILDENQGYIKEDKVILEIYVKADPPKNILTHKEFQKKIQDYKRLADLQCQRGLIDKAIECNTQALKFCKERDPQCKAELEAQKAQLIEMKLKQSIQRIEKGNDPKCEDDTAANLNALRHALGTTTKTSAKNQNQSQKVKAKDSTTTTNECNKTNPRPKTPPPPTERSISVPKTPPPKFTAKKTVVGCNSKDEKMSVSASTMTKEENTHAAKNLVPLGQFNKSLLNSSEFESVMGVRCNEEDEELLPKQVRHYLEHLSEQHKETMRLSYFSSEVENVAMHLPAAHDPRQDEFLKSLVELQKMQQIESKRRRRGQQICDCCLEEGIRATKRETSDSGCQTEFVRSVGNSTGLTQQVQQVDKSKEWMNNTVNPTVNKTTNTTAPLPTLPVRRKKALAKKSVQHQQQVMPKTPEKWQQPPLSTPKANPRSQNFTAADFAAAFNTSQDGSAMLAATMDTKQTFDGLIDSANISAGMGMNLFDMATMSNELEPGFLGKGFDGTNMNIAGQQAALASHYMLTRQYIEEWLRQNAPNLQVHYDTDGNPLSFSNIPPHLEELIQQQKLGLIQNNTIQQNQNKEINDVQTIVNVIRMASMNSRNIQQRVCDFFDALESHSNFRELGNSINRLLSLAGENKSATKNNDNPPIGGDQRMFFDDETQDFTLARDLRQMEQMLSTKLNLIFNQFHNISLADLINKIESRIKLLEETTRVIKSQFEAKKESESNLTKQFLEAQKGLHAMSDKYEKLAAQLKDRKNEIRKLEKKAKSEAQLAAENTELHEKVDTLKKELAQVQRQLSDEQAKYKRDTQSLADSKKHLNAELNAKYSEIQKLNNQLEEKSQLLKKNESHLANERKSNATTVSNLSDRAKKAEIALLEQRLEDGLKVLDRAKDDCGLQIKQLEELQKKTNTSTELEVIKKNISEWENKREEVVSLISQSKSEFVSHITAIKSGKQLSQLPKIQVAKPPPCPKLYPMPQPQQPQVPTASRTSPQRQSPLPIERKVITPPNSRTSTTTTMTAKNTTEIAQPQGLHQQKFVPFNPSVSPNSAAYGSSHFVSTASGGSANVTPVKNHLHSSNLVSQTAMMQPNMTHPPQQHAPQGLNNSPLTPIGVRPQSFQNGVVPSNKAAFSAFASMHQVQHQQPTSQSPTAFAQSQQQQQQCVQMSQHPHSISAHQSQPQTNNAQQPPLSNGCYPLQQQLPPQPPNAVASGGFWGSNWGDQLNNISELFGHGRSFGPLGSEFGRNENSTAGSNMISSTSRNSVPTVSSGNGAGSAASVIGSGRNLQNSSPSPHLSSGPQQQQPQNNGWSSFSDATWNASVSGRQS